jgi:hypothetical protein
VDLHVAAGVPDAYVGDPSLKLGFYRRIASAATLADLDGLRTEIEDRCGPLPETGERLFDVARLRVLGQEHGIARFSMERGGTLQMTILDPVRALPFLRGKLGRSLRLPEPPLAIVAEPVRPAAPERALARFLELLAPARA